jgi:hypothetical protein
MQLLRKIIPRSVLVPIRLAYIYYFLRGHSRRNAKGFNIDAQSNPIPWWTYPAIDFLDTLDFTNSRIFEYGSGSSTLWWSKRAQFVAGVEMEPDWYRAVNCASRSNVDIRLCEDGGFYPGVINHFEYQFDVIVIDGAERYKSAQNAVDKVNTQGIIILDNSEWYPNTAAFLRSTGYNQIDFFGFGPINSFPAVTSIFFTPDCQLFAKKLTHNLRVIGGNKLKDGALDDHP